MFKSHQEFTKKVSARKMRPSFTGRAKEGGAGGALTR